jgi:hypothetical protein
MTNRKREKSHDAVPAKPVTPGSALYRLMELVAAAVAKDLEYPSESVSEPRSAASAMARARRREGALKRGCSPASQGRTI